MPLEKAAAMHPLLLSDPQELARQFNEDEAVWHRFQEKRLLRRLLGAQSLLPALQKLPA